MRKGGPVPMRAPATSGQGVPLIRSNDYKGDRRLPLDGCVTAIGSEAPVSRSYERDGTTARVTSTESCAAPNERPRMRRRSAGGHRLSARIRGGLPTMFGDTSAITRPLRGPAFGKGGAVEAEPPEAGGSCA